MAELRSHVAGGDYNKELKQQLRKDIWAIDAEIANLHQKKRKLQRDLIEAEIAPFKIGDYAIVEVPSGKSTKEQKCLIEFEGGTLYVRPLKKDGELSGRHFSIYPIKDKTYRDYLKEVKE